eukprot:scaffold7539_cov390-Prasinococcus_capsulatus_cf.AAC.2
MIVQERSRRRHRGWLLTLAQGMLVCASCTHSDAYFLNWPSHRVRNPSLLRPRRMAISVPKEWMGSPSFLCVPATTGAGAT